MLEILNKGRISTDIITDDVLGYLSFINPEQPSGTVYNYSTKELLDTIIPKSTSNSIQDGLPVGQFSGAQSVSFDIKRPIGTGDFTLEVWNSIPAANIGEVLIALANNNNQSGVVTNIARIGIGSNTGKLYTPTSYGSNNTTTATIPSNNWNHFCAMRKNNVTRVYLNGTVVNTFTHTGNIVPTLFCLGAYAAGTRRYFKGQIAEAAITAIPRYEEEGFIPPFPLFEV